MPVGLFTFSIEWLYSEDLISYVFLCLTLKVDAMKDM